MRAATAALDLFIDLNCRAKPRILIAADTTQNARIARAFVGYGFTA
jgi:hypothetical protein